MATKIMTKIRYKLVFNRGGRLNQCGEGLVQIECTQNHRRIYFSTHTYLQPNQFSRCCVVNHELADNLNYALYKMMHEIENIELEYIKRGVVVTLPMLREAYRSIQRLLGHQKLQTTQIYSEVDRTAILNDLRGTALQNNDNTEQLKNDFDNGTI